MMAFARLHIGGELMKKFLYATAFMACLLIGGAAQADCDALPNHAKLKQALQASVKPAGGPENGGLETHMWAAVVDRDGIVCAVVYSGKAREDQWPGSRVIAAEKANTANAFSLKTLAISTANLYGAVQPAAPLYGLENSHPVNAAAVYGGSPNYFGTENDPLVGQLIGGIITFGGGLPLYTKDGIIGALGVSGDTSCADHNVAWRVRQTLDLAYVPRGVSKNNDDGIIYDIFGGVNARSKSGYGHPTCGGQESKITKELKAGG